MQVLPASYVKFIESAGGEVVPLPQIQFKDSTEVAKLDPKIHPERERERSRGSSKSSNKSSLGCWDALF